MGEGRLSRRETLAFASAAVLCAKTTQAAAIYSGESSRIRPEVEPAYIPPSTINTVNDLYSRMTVPVRIGEAGPFEFVVDTGANQSVIASELAASLGLPTETSSALNGVAGMLMAPTTHAILDVGGRRQPVTLSQLPEVALGSKGLLGLDCMTDRRLTLDFKGRALHLGRSGRMWGGGRDVVVRGRAKDGRLTLIDTTIAGMKVDAFLDSGAQNTIGNMALRTLAVDRRAAMAWLKTPIVSATGQTIDADIANLPSFAIGGITLPNWPVAFADLHTFHLWNMIDKPALLLGVDVLSRFETVSLDFGRGEVRFRAPGNDGAMVA